MSVLVGAVVDTAIDVVDFVLGGNALAVISGLCLFTIFMVGFLLAFGVPNVQRNARYEAIAFGASAIYTTIVMTREALGVRNDPRPAVVAAVADATSRLAVGILAGLAAVLLRILHRVAS